MNETSSGVTTATTQAPPGGGPLPARLRAILAIVLIADILDLMDSTITNIAAPSIVADIGGGQSLIKWLGASYALAMGVLLVVGGRLGDRYGKRRVFLVSIAGFTLASLACGLAADPVMLIAARLLQGGFGALLIPQGMGLLLASFSREQLPRAFAAFGPIMGGSAVLGPIVAGVIINANIAGLGWRPVFLVNIVLGGIGLAAAARLLPADGPGDETPLDGLGAGLLGAAMLGLIYGLITGSTDGWTALPLVSLALGALFFIAFALRQRAAANPLLLPSLLRNKGFTSGMLLGLVFFAAVGGLSYVISLFLQTALHFTPRGAALAMAPLMVGIIIASFLGRPLVPRLGRSLVAIGLAVTLAGAAGLWTTVLNEGVHTSPWLMAPSLLVLGVGMGLCFTSLFDVAIGDIAEAEAGSASGSLSAVQQLAGAIGSAVVTTVYFSEAASRGAGHAMTVSVAVVAGIAALGLGLVWLLPRKAQAEPEW